MGLVVVTGGSRGLGYETARALQGIGHQIVLVAKDPERLPEAALKLSCDYRIIDLENID